MTTFPSKYSLDELKERWDDFTSPARFAGNDDTMDLIFVSKRKGNKLRLVRKARSAYELFSCVFRGEIVEKETGCEIRGNFTKSIFDYALIGSIIGVLFYIRLILIDRGANLSAINTLLAVGIIGGVLLLLNTRSTKRRYAEFIFRITEQETNAFKPKKELEKED